MKRKPRFFPLLWLLIGPSWLLSCVPAATEPILIQEERTEDYVIALLGDSTELQQSSNRLILEFRDLSTNELTAVDNVRIQASMSMPGMAPMFGDISGPDTMAPGRYEFDAQFTMAGGWALIVTFDPGRRVQFNVNAY